MSFLQAFLIKVNLGRLSRRMQINQLLNLNNRWLMANRLQALLGVIDYLNRKGWTASNLNQQISKWSNMDAEGRYKEYNSIVVWYLKKKQRQCDL